MSGLTGTSLPLLAAATATGGASSTPSATATGGSKATTAAEDSRTQVDFTKLLVAQFTHQSPLNPTSSDQFLNQLAMIQMVNEVHKLRSDMGDWAKVQGLAGASSLVGRIVTVKDGTATASGTVNSVSVNDGNVTLGLHGRDFPMSDLLQVR